MLLLIFIQQVQILQQWLYLVFYYNIILLKNHLVKNLKSEQLASQLPVSYIVKNLVHTTPGKGTTMDWAYWHGKTDKYYFLIITKI